MIKIFFKKKSLRKKASSTDFLLTAYKWTMRTVCVQCLFNKTNMLLKPCGQFEDTFADSNEKGVTSFDVTP